MTHNVPIEDSILVIQFPTRLDGGEDYCPSEITCSVNAGSGTSNAACNCVNKQLGVTLSNMSQSSFVLYVNSLNNPISTTIATGFSAWIELNDNDIEITDPGN